MPLKNGEKALSIDKSAYKYGKLPSGWSDDDLDKFILDEMWRMLKVSDTEPESPVDANDEVEVEDAADEDSTRAPEISEHPEEWIFPGWVAYCTFGPHAHDEHKSPLFEVGDWVKNKQSASGSGGQEEQQRALAEQTNTIRTNSLDCGVALGATKKDIVIIAQAENRAEQQSIKCNVLVLTQMIESKQKWLASLTKLLEIPGMDAEQRTKILNKVIDLMDEIQQDEKDLHQVSQNKRMKSDIVDSFLTTATISTNGKASEVTPHALDLR